jgi:hypothetical protein
MSLYSPWDPCIANSIYPPSLGLEEYTGKIPQPEPARDRAAAAGPGRARGSSEQAGGQQPRHRRPEVEGERGEGGGHGHECCLLRADRDSTSSAQLVTRVPRTTLLLMWVSFLLSNLLTLLVLPPSWSVMDPVFRSLLWALLPVLFAMVHNLLSICQFTADVMWGRHYSRRCRTSRSAAGTQPTDSGWFLEIDLVGGVS